MARKNRFVAPETRKINLGESGDWIEIKKELNVGDDRAYRSAGLKRLTGSPGSSAAAVDVDWTELALARVTVYLLDWSFENADGKRVDLSPSAIRNLDPATFEEVDTAIVEHIKEMTDAKKATGGEPTPPSQ
jgi:hypothetical protein